MECQAEFGVRNLTNQKTVCIIPVRTYFYSIKAGDFTSPHKMVVER
jgi:hypothetical protein